MMMNMAMVMMMRTTATEDDDDDVDDGAGGGDGPKYIFATTALSPLVFYSTVGVGTAAAAAWRCLGALGSREGFDDVGLQGVSDVHQGVLVEDHVHHVVVGDVHVLAVQGRLLRRRP